MKKERERERNERFRYVLPLCSRYSGKISDTFLLKRTKRERGPLLRKMRLGPLRAFRSRALTQTDV